MRRLTLVLAMAAALAACRPLTRLQAPEGFTAISITDTEHRYQAADGVTLRVTTVPNPGGELYEWGAQLDDELDDRGYVGMTQFWPRSADLLEGEGLEYLYTPPGEGSPATPPVTAGLDSETAEGTRTIRPAHGERFYIVVLFATREHRIKVELDGSYEHWQRYSAEVHDLIKTLRVR